MMRNRAFWYVVLAVLCCSLVLLALAAPMPTNKSAALRSNESATPRTAVATGSPAVPVNSDAGSAISSAMTGEAGQAYARWLRTGTATPQEKALIQEHFLRTTSDTNPLDNTGGPDASGYAFKDNVSPDTATFNWIELCGDPLASDGPNGDDASVTAALGFNFPFYGTVYTSCFPTTNGLIGFGSSNTGWCASDPATNVPAAAYIAAMWMDQYTMAGIAGAGCTVNGTLPYIRYRSFGTYFVVEWKKNPQYGNTGNLLSYEAILYQDGKVKIQFATDFTYPTAYTCTQAIGIDAPGTGNGLRYYYTDNITPLGFAPAASRAIWFYQGALPDGRCCYGDPNAPTCVDNDITECAALSGTWTGGTNCAAGPCPILPPNDNCANAGVPATLPVTFTGDNTLATHDCSLLTLGEGETWHVFTTTVTENVTVSYCGTTGPAGPWGDVYIVLANGCPCGSLTYATNWTQASCADGNWTVNFLNLPAGTYYLPVLREASMNSYGPYTIHVGTPTGRCCYGDPNAPSCAVNTQSECAALTGVWSQGGNCDLPCPAVPPNDNCEWVTPQTLPATFTGTRDGATPDCNLFAQGEGNVWIAFTIPVASDVTLDYCGSPVTGNMWLNLALGCPCTGFTAAGAWNSTFCPPNYQQVWTGLAAGTYYYPVLADAANGATGPYTIHVSAVPYQEPTGRCCYGDPQAPSCAVNTQTECTALAGTWTQGLDCNTACPVPPPNDACPNAVHLNGAVSNLAWNNIGTNQTADNTYCGMYHDIWYCWNTNCEVDVNVNLCGSTFDTKLAVFNTDANCTCPTGTGFVCNDDTCGLQSSVSFHAMPGRYMIQVGSYGSTTMGTGVLTVNTSALCDCDPATAVTAILDANNHVWVHFNAPVTTGRYKIYTTTVKNNDGDPRNNDPNFTLAATVTAAVVGQQVWEDVSPILPYANYVVVHDCSPVGRCCYNNNSNCANNSSADCAGLSGVWTAGTTCELLPCNSLVYCTATHNFGCDEYIGTVAVGSINNSTGCGASPYYEDYTSITTNMTIGTAYPITVTNGGNLYSSDAVSVWVDWNNNSSFTDAGEQTNLTNDGSGHIFTGSITPPAGSQLGNHRMRVRMGYSWTPSPCGATSYGETEDYTIVVQ